MVGASEKPGKIFYSMGEVSEMLDVKPSLIRFWEAKFDVVKPAKNKKGNRLFSPEDVRNLKTIYHLVKERGMTLSGAQKQMKASRHSIERDMDLTERLQSIRSLLAEVRNSLGDGGNERSEVNYGLREEEEVIDVFMDDVTEEIADEDVADEVIEDVLDEVIEEVAKPEYIEQTLF